MASRSCSHCSQLWTGQEKSGPRPGTPSTWGPGGPRRLASSASTVNVLLLWMPRILCSLWAFAFIRSLVSAGHKRQAMPVEGPKI